MALVVLMMAPLAGVDASSGKGKNRDLTRENKRKQVIIKKLPKTMKYDNGVKFRSHKEDGRRYGIIKYEDSFRPKSPSHY